jgi:5-oxoprolinase (ATP-hydrolysing) subunit C
MSRLIIETCGPGTSIQDFGRFGWQRYGVGPAGAMDRLSLAMANVLVGNGPGAGGIEFTLAGGRFRVSEGPVRVAAIGADLKIDGVAVPALSSVTVEPERVIEVLSARVGLYSYLAIAGGLQLTPELGSLSLHVRAGIGGIGGRALMTGDHLTLNAASVGGDDLAAAQGIARDEGPIRVLLGPQDDYFSAAGIATLLSSAYLITPQADRMGLRLSGPVIAHGPKGYNIVSDGIVTGSIQVPGAGTPIVLLADRQTTGGYPKIATVISADLGRLAQMRPGHTLRFDAVTRAAAVAALRAEADGLVRFRAELRPAGAAGLDSERLLSLTLIDGWVSARD